MHTEQAHAKLTVSLKMTGLRPDGYHLIDAEMVSLDLADTLTFTEGDGLTITIAGTAASGLSIEANADNLVAKALRMLDRRAHVSIVKRIPAGGGLGGGSSDAAAVFRWAKQTGQQDIVAAAQLGADVSFCILGGRARVRGIGEICDPLPFVPRSYTLLSPPFGVSTPAVYRAWDALGGPTVNGPNDLEPAALVVEPRLGVWRDRLGNLTGQTPVLAGSGSTWFVEGTYSGSFDGVDLLPVQTIPALPPTESRG